MFYFNDLLEKVSELLNFILGNSNKNNISNVHSFIIWKYILSQFRFRIGFGIPLFTLMLYLHQRLVTGDTEELVEDTN